MSERAPALKLGGVGRRVPVTVMLDEGADVTVDAGKVPVGTNDVLLTPRLVGVLTKLVGVLKTLAVRSDDLGGATIDGASKFAKDAGKPSARGSGSKDAMS